MKSIESRLEQLEKKTGPGEPPTGARLYDFDCNEVTGAKILRLPTETKCGLALMPDGSRKEIDSTKNFTMYDVLMERKRQAEAREVRPKKSEEEEEAERKAAEVRDRQQRELLFLRKPGEREPYINKLLKWGERRVAEEAADGCM